MRARRKKLAEMDEKNRARLLAVKAKEVRMEEMQAKKGGQVE
jgi:hypothetical protein